MKRVLAVAALMALTLAGCASGPRLSTGEKLAAYRSHAGQPVASFSFFGSLHGWTELGDRHLAVQTRPSEAWLLTLTSSCPGLEWASSIGLSSQLNRVHANFDRVIVPENAPVSCRIAQIQPLDTQALKSDLSSLRQARIEQREQAAEPQP